MASAARRKAAGGWGSDKQNAGYLVHATVMFVKQFLRGAQKAQ
jgi:hypothetical protein